MKLLLENREMLQNIGMSKELGSVALKCRKQIKMKTLQVSTERRNNQQHGKNCLKTRFLAR